MSGAASWVMAWSSYPGIQIGGWRTVRRLAGAYVGSFIIAEMGRSIGAGTALSRGFRLGSHEATLTDKCIRLSGDAQNSLSASFHDITPMRAFVSTLGGGKLNGVQSKSHALVIYPRRHFHSLGLSIFLTTHSEPMPIRSYCRVQSDCSSVF
jgi:hypothetical protein